jgi:predicted nuclease with TOPRIM domain
MATEERLDKIERDIEVIKSRLGALEKYDELLYGKNSLLERVTSLEAEVRELRKEIAMVTRLQNRNLTLILSAIAVLGTIVSVLISAK